MRTRTLINLIGDVAWLADLPAPSTTTYITKASVIDRINEGIAEMFNLVVAAAGDSAYRTTTTITTAAGTSAYDLPNDFYQLKSVEMVLNSSDRVLLEQFTNAERPFLASATPGWNGEPFKYKVQGKSSYNNVERIEFLPTPASAIDVAVAYIFAPTRLAGDNDAIDGFAGFEDYAVLFAARRCALKEENFDLSDRIGGEMSRVQQDILDWAKSIDAFSPPRIQITRQPRFSRYTRRRM